MKDDFSQQVNEINKHLKKKKKYIYIYIYMKISFGLRLFEHLIEVTLTHEKQKPWMISLIGILGGQHWQSNQDVSFVWDILEHNLCNIQKEIIQLPGYL